MCCQRKLKEVDAVAFLMMESAMESVVMDSHAGKCFQRAGLVGWVVILVRGMSNMVFGFLVIPPNGRLLLGSGSLVSEVGIRRLLWRVLLEPLV